MNPTDMAVFVQDMGELISTLNALGLPGLLAIVLSGPAVVVCLIVYLNINSSMRRENMLESYREDTQEILLKLNEKSDSFIETQQVLINQINKDSQQNQSLQTLIINNTTAMEQLKCAVKSVIG